MSGHPDAPAGSYVLDAGPHFTLDAITGGRAQLLCVYCLPSDAEDEELRKVEGTRFARAQCRSCGFSGPLDMRIWHRPARTDDERVARDERIREWFAGVGRPLPEGADPVAAIVENLERGGWL